MTGQLWSACWAYGTKVADEHRWEDDGTTGPWEQGAGPLCMVCGLPRGTWERETAEPDGAAR